MAWRSEAEQPERRRKILQPLSAEKEVKGVGVAFVKQKGTIKRGGRENIYRVQGKFKVTLEGGYQLT